MNRSAPPAPLDADNGTEIALPVLAEPESMTLPAGPETSRPLLLASPLGPLGDPASRRRRVLALALAILGLASLAIDLPVARFCKADRTPHELQILFNRAETFGHAYGVLAIVVTMAVVDAARRRYASRLVLAALGAGLLTDLLKLIVFRSRPRFYDLSLGLWPSFRGVLGWDLELGWSVLLDNTQQSLPSAHTATAVGLAVGLGILYPQGRRWFAVLAFLCALNRIDGCAHFVSDTCWGAAVGVLVADWAFSRHRTIDWIDWIIDRKVTPSPKGRSGRMADRRTASIESGRWLAEHSSIK